MKRHASRSDSGLHQFLMRVPRDVAPRVVGRRIEIELPGNGHEKAVTASFTLGTFAKTSLHTRDATVADVRRLTITAHLAKVYDGARREAVVLSQRETVALAGEVYRRLRQHHRDNPGTPEQWEAWKAFTRAALEGRLAAGEAPVMTMQPKTGEEERFLIDIFGLGDLTVSVDRVERDTYDETALKERCGRLAVWVLHERGIEVNRPSHLALVREIAKAALQAGWQLKREAGGDYRPDPQEGRFPPLETASASRITFDGLFDRWKTEKQPAPSTVTTWRGIVAAFVQHLGHDDPAKVSPENVVAWKDALLAAGRRAKTINDSHLTCLGALYRYGIANKLLTANPFEGIKVASRQRAGTRMLPYDDAEIARLLQLAAQETHPARRWLPLLAACTGARIGELAQAWGSQVREIDGVPVLEIKPAPDGGTLKNEGSERTVPLHPVLIEAGFLAFVRDQGNRPLFYSKPAKRGAEARHPSKGTANHLGTWIREQGFADPRKAPSHAVRHWFKSTASRVGVPDSVADALQGHADRSSAGTYRHFDLATLAEAVRRMTIPQQKSKATS